MLRRAVKTLLSHGAPANNYQMKGAAMSATRTEKWDLLAGVVLERLPVISKTPKPIEKEYLAYLNQIEFERSLKSDFEMREEKDRMIADLQQKGKLDVDMDVAIQQTAQDLKDSWKEELAQFQFSDRRTEADRTKDTRSLDRKLEETLVLLVRQQIGTEQLLLLPQGVRHEGETLRQTAERVLRERCGDQIEAIVYGNAPCGFYKYKYPKAARSESIGAKVFFYRAGYRSGSVHVSGAEAKKGNKEPQQQPFEWLDRSELLGRVPASYSASLSQFIL